MQSVRNVVVVGHGMVGHRFVEALRSRDVEGAWRVTVLAEESDAAYDRVGLTGYTEHWDRERLALAGNSFGGDDLVELRLGSRVTGIDRAGKSVVTTGGDRVGYDALVLATGSSAFVPPVPGHDLPACHVYRTLDDLDAIRADANRAGGPAAGVVIGGGLLGLEAANALRQFGLRAHVVERAPRLLNQQLDDAGGALLNRMIGGLGIDIHLDVATDSIEARDGGLRVTLGDGSAIDTRLVIFAAGVRPRDELGRAAGLALAERGGVLTDLSCATGDPNIYAIGEVAAIEGRCYGLVGPGYTSAEVVADRLLGAAPSSRRPTCPPNSSCSVSTWPASATRWAPLPIASRSSSTTRSSRPTPSSCSPTTPRHCSAASWSGTLRRTACCGRWSVNHCPVTRWH